MPARKQRFVRVTVTDTGHGLFGEARTRALDPFFSTMEGAPGLGLTSVAMIVRNFQGWLHIETDSSGTSIHIHLPALGPITR
jgi:C4-dicarboxylate-specific signal transduction histidine kinase